MNKLSVKSILLLSCLLCQGFAAASQEGWKLESYKDGIKIYSKISDTSDYKAFKATVVVQASVESFVALLQDIPAIPDWIPDTKVVLPLRKSGDTLQIHYSESSVPFPFENRDGIYQLKFKWLDESKQLWVDIIPLPDYLKEKKNIVRVHGKGYWNAKVLKNGQLEVTLCMEVDPGGAIPAWLVNMFVTSIPQTTLKNLRNIIAAKKYQVQKYKFIHH